MFRSLVASGFQGFPRFTRIFHGFLWFRCRGSETRNLGPMNGPVISTWPDPQPTFRPVLPALLPAGDCAPNSRIGQVQTGFLASDKSGYNRGHEGGHHRHTGVGASDRADGSVRVGDPVTHTA